MQARLAFTLMRSSVGLAILTACSAGLEGLPEADGGAPEGSLGDSGDAAAAPDAPKVDAAMPEPDIDAIPWEAGPTVGYGVSRKDTQNPLGSNAVIAYAGYQIDLPAAQAWVTALYRASLRARGVRYVWAVQGPNDPQYLNQEIGNSKIAATLVPLVSVSTKFVLVVGHSSGSFVAHELLGQLSGGLDPQDVTANRVVYFDLDGGQSGLTAPAVARLKRGYFVASHDGVTGTYSPNVSTMKSLGATYAGAGGYWENDASAPGATPARSGAST
jgi:hypothetical protein